MIDGVLVIDKPRGLTSHDVVAAARRTLGESRIGHSGTLDPIATGVLPLACGRATRLVRFLTASDKDYDAEIRIGLATDTYDVTGVEVARSDRRPSAHEITAALRELTGTYLQTPPLYSAKKIGGQRAYRLARQARRGVEGAMAGAGVDVRPAPVPVRVERLDLVDLRDDVASICVTCSAGFYVRSLAHDLGARLGTGACLQGLRRTRSGSFDLGVAVALDDLVRDAAAAARRMIPPSMLLTELPAVTLNDEGLRWASQGRILGAAQLTELLPQGAAWVRLLDGAGRLVALGRPTALPGSLHPSIVLN